MAQLELKHIASKDYIKSTELFFDKVFGDHKKYNHDFSTKKGVFSADKIDIKYQDGKSKIFTKAAERNNYLKKTSLI